MLGWSKVKHKFGVTGRHFRLESHRTQTDASRFKGRGKAKKLQTVPNVRPVESSCSDYSIVQRPLLVVHSNDYCECQLTTFPKVSSSPWAMYMWLGNVEGISGTVTLFVFNYASLYFDKDLNQLRLVLSSGKTYIASIQGMKLWSLIGVECSRLSPGKMRISVTLDYSVCLTVGVNIPDLPDMSIPHFSWLTPVTSFPRGQLRSQDNRVVLLIGGIILLRKESSELIRNKIYRSTHPCNRRLSRGDVDMEVSWSSPDIFMIHPWS